MGLFSCLFCRSDDDADIKELDYSRSQLYEVPSNVFTYERTLEKLQLDGNKISELPRLLFHCEELRTLDLSDNELRHIPELVSRLINLQYLYLNRNYLKHTGIPHEIHRCQNLIILDVSSNVLDKVPEGLTTLANLTELCLNDTYIEYLPASFGRLCNLVVLEIRDNCLSSLPKSMKRLSKLQKLDASNNDFLEWPEVIGSLTNLTELWMNGNCLNCVGENIKNLQKLEHLDLSHNDLYDIPREITCCISLNMLLLSNNMIQNIPEAFGNLKNLETLKLDQNRLDFLPASIGLLQKLQELDIQLNSLNTLPNSLGMLRKLNYLIVSHNFIRSLPIELGSCNQLTTLNFHYNRLSELPHEIGHLTNLTSLGLVGNSLQCLPISVFNLRQLRALWLSENQNQPLISLQKELRSNNEIVLTCVFLPQGDPGQSKETSATHSLTSPNRHICFSESSAVKELPPRLSRSPTPYPKDFHRYQRSLANALKKSREGHNGNMNVDADASGVQIKEAKVTPMRPNAQEDVHSVPATSRNDVEYIASAGDWKNVPSTSRDGDHTFYSSSTQTPFQPYVYEQDSQNRNVLEQHYSDNTTGVYENRHTQHDIYASKPATIGKSPRNEPSLQVYTAYRTTELNRNIQPESNNNKGTFDSPNSTGGTGSISNDNNNSNTVHMTVPNTSNQENTRQSPQTEATQPSIGAIRKLPPNPPPYDIAKMYSKNAHFYNQPMNVNLKISDIKPKRDVHFKDEPKIFTQDQPVNILTPQPQHPYRILDADNNPIINGNPDSPTSAHFNEGGTANVDETTSVGPLFIFVPPTQQLDDAKKYMLRKLVYDVTTPGRLSPSASNNVQTENANNSHEEDIREDSLGPWPPIITEPQYIQMTHRLHIVKQMLMTGDPQTQKYAVAHEEYTNLDFFIAHLQMSTLKESIERTVNVLSEVVRTEKPPTASMSQNQGHPSTSSQEDWDDEDGDDGEQSRPTGFNWVFGPHRNRRIIEVAVTPCCYVLGFTITCNEHGVFIDEVDKEGNSYKKLYTGDKILMIDDKNISHLPPDEAERLVNLLGPEAEVIVVSRI